MYPTVDYSTLRHGGKPKADHQDSVKKSKSSTSKTQANLPRQRPISLSSLINTLSPRELYVHVKNAIDLPAVFLGQRSSPRRYDGSKCMSQYLDK